MSTIIAVVFLLAHGANAGTVTPVQKVLQMMGDMKAKALNEKQNEIKTFAKFEQFCEDTEVAKGRAINEGKEQSDKLSADIQKFDSDAKVLGEEITKLDASLDQAQADHQAATQLREKENADYSVTHADYTESIEDLEMGVGKLKSMMSAMPGASSASLLQALASKDRMPSHAKGVLTAFIAESSEEDRAFAENMQPQATSKVYESKSGGIVDMMDKLKDKLSDEKAALEKEEMNAQHSYDMMAQSLTDAIAEQTDSRSNKASTKKQMESSSAEAKGDLSDTQATLAEDEKYMTDLQTTCAQKQSDFGARQKLRAEELDAIDQAIEIIAGGAVAGAAGTHLPGLIQTTSLAQLRSSSQSPTQMAVQSYLASQGERLGSHLLAALALRVGQDPFAKISKMIKDMIVKLTEEANEEAEHKGFCDSEMNTNQQTRDEKSTQVETLSAQIDQMTAESEKLATETSQLTAQVSEIDAAVAEATSVRQAEKVKNTATVADAAVAKVAVGKALTILKEFYGKAAGATSLVQQGGVSDDMPETFDAPFQGTGGEGGILGMLEVILSDFERLEAETSENEVAGQKEYETFTADSTTDKDTKTADIKHKNNRSQKLASDTASAKKDLKSTQEELDAALAYFEKLKPSCVDAGVSYEERVARRKEEIESLNEALKILNGDELA